MAIINLQRFMVAYVRDITLRNQFTQNKEAYYAQFELTSSERELAEQIDYSILQVTAEKMLKDRIDRRESEFQEFFRILRLLDEYEEFVYEFAVQYPQGSLSRKSEAERLSAFAAAYIRKRSLPDILLELMEYSRLAADMTYSSKQSPRAAGPLILPRNQRLYLREPYAVRKFHYDLVRFLETVESRDDVEAFPAQDCLLFFQKSYRNALSCVILEVDDETLLNLLKEGLSFNTILLHAPNKETRANWADSIEYLFQEGILGLDDADDTLKGGENNEKSDRSYDIRPSG